MTIIRRLLWWSVAVGLIAQPACSSLKKDNIERQPITPGGFTEEKAKAYYFGVQGQLDEFGLVRLGDSIGDSTLFSCLLRAAKGTTFDPEILSDNGRPLRHALLKSNKKEFEKLACTLPPMPGKSACTPTSKDMVEGWLWCLHTYEDKEKALSLISKTIQYGRAHKGALGTWMFCTDEEIKDWSINLSDQAGRCTISLSLIKDVYRLARKLGYPCDSECKTAMEIGPNIPANLTGFERHLAVLATVRNGQIEGAINDNSLKIVLENAAKENPRNALYQAAYHLFLDGDQRDAEARLNDETLFPSDHLPTVKNYCSPYLFERDESSKGDWFPCEAQENNRGKGIEWLFSHYLIGSNRD